MSTSNRQLFNALYEELCTLARSRLRREQAPISTGTLVHELFLAIDGKGLDFPSHAQFLAYACRAMRSLLVDMARARLADKRHAELMPLTAGLDVADHGGGTPEQWLRVHQALQQLGAEHPHLLLLAEMRVIADQSQAQIAQALAISESTVQRDWRLAKAYLYDKLGHTLPRSADPQLPAAA